MWIAGPALCVALIAGAFGLLLLRSQRIYEARPTVEGRIVSAEIVKRPVRSKTFGAGGRLYLTWLLEVRYAYAVDGREIEVTREPSTKRLMATAEGADAAAPPAWLSERLRDFPPGKAVTVRYRRGDPADSVIDVDRTSATRLLLLAGGALLLGLLLWVVARRG